MSLSTTKLTTDVIYSWLEEVKDPEIPVLSLVDLGVITSVSIDNDSVHIEMTPTFVGCPAMDYMKTEILAVMEKHGTTDVTVDINFRNAWSSDKITEKGKEALKKFGFAPPPSTREIIYDLDILEHAICPRCNGTHTEMKSPFGPTLCRSLHYCFDCREAFEQFKPI
ncbi:MAG: phenylacetate-CoA oxygenase subunit PaaJ [Cyclobacteriaceae bacterium]|nr:phenylacetate-CoA oxygenase subunit PaaJ [Cyclobacteriaceae bacterium]